MLISCDTLENLLKILNDLRRSVSEVEYCYDNKELHITVSIGFSVLDAESVKNKVNFVDQADKALYDSKDNGRNQVTMYKESIIKSD
jgi:diguanylate cyclase (GGDEF)-like protein